MVKNLPAKAGDARDMGWIPGLGRSLGGENGNPLQYSSLVNPMDRGAWWAMAHGVTKSQTQLSTCARTHTHTHTRVLTHIHMCAHRDTCVHTCTRTHVCIHECVCTYIHVCMHTGTHVHACACTHVRAHAYTRVHTHTLCSQSATISSRSHIRPRT